MALKAARSITSEGRDRRAGRAVLDAGRTEAHPQRQRFGGRDERRSALVATARRRGALPRATPPSENGYAESFRRRLREEFLAIEVFDNLARARRLTAAWKDDYNT
ncbi:MAG: transposase [Pirellulales bacterium]|nr:transposase [Pirellulales bacterium]